jgi:hypothetical protein
MSPDLTDSEIDAICDGYTQSAAKCRYLRSLGLHVERKPNGRPLVNRSHYDAIRGGARAAQAGTGTGAINWSTP